MYYSLPRGSYREQKFLEYVLEYLGTRCPLCGGEHPPKFHAFAVRLYKATHDVYQVEKALRHANVAVTESYLRSLGLGS